MADIAEQIVQLEAAIAAQERLRPVLGDAVVETVMTTLRAQIATLQAQQQGRPADSEQERLTRMQSYLPKALANKLRQGATLQSERRQVTALFADLSGFTPLSERLDPEEVQAFLNDLYEELAVVIYTYEGYVEKFIGDAVVAVFGALVMHEDDPERALRAAIDMRERMEQLNRRWEARLGQPLTLHIGINTGLAVTGNIGSDLGLTYGVIGDTINTAARLQSAAQPSQILVSRDTYRLTSGAFDFVALDPIQVKGKREPVVVYELQRARLHPGKTRGLKELSAAYVGREAELIALAQVSERLVAGTGQIVTISGEAGLGKSRLLAEWYRARPSGICWLEGRAFGHTTLLAYGPFLDLMRRYAGITDDDGELVARQRLHDALDPVFPNDELAFVLFAQLLALRLNAVENERLAALQPQQIAQRIVTLLSQLLTTLARQQPVVLVLEDIHWADSTSLDMLANLLLLTERLPLALVLVARQRWTQFGAALAAALRTHAAQHLDLALQPLSPEVSADLVHKLLALPTLPLTLRDLIVEKAEGNPFFVEEMIRTLIERGALMRDVTGEQWLATPLLQRVQVPDTLQGLLMARLDRLPEETKRVVQQAAVIGRVFLYRVLRHMLEQTEGIDAELSQLEQHELIRERTTTPEVEYIFKHALTQDVAYQSLITSRRRLLHRKAGEALEAVFAERLSEFYTIVGTHYWQGEAWEQAALYLRKAGDDAARLFAYAEARIHYQQTVEALAKLPSSPARQHEQIETLIKLVNVSLVADSPSINIARLIEAEQLIAIAESNHVLNQAELDRRMRLHYALGRAYYYYTHPGEALVQFRQMLQLAERLQDPDRLGVPRSMIARVLSQQGAFTSTVKLFSDTFGALERTQNWSDWIWNQGYLGFCRTVQGDYRTGQDDGKRALARAQALKHATATAVSHIFLALIHWQGGNLPAAIEAAEATIAVASQSGDRMPLHLGYGFRAWALARLGEHAAAQASFEEYSAMVASMGGRLVYADWFQAARAELALLGGQPMAAAGLAETALGFAQEIGGVFAEGIAERVWGLALAEQGDWAAAEPHLAASVRTLMLHTAQVEAARTHAAWGRICLAQGQTQAAQAHLSHALDQFTITEALAEAEQIRKLLKELNRKDAKNAKTRGD